MKYPLIILLILALCFSSCKEDKVETTLNDNGETIEKKFYDKNNNLTKIIRYYDRNPNQEYRITFKKKDLDSLIYFYDNGTVFKTGKIDLNSQLFGTWNLFDRNGNKREIREFVIYKGKTALNRVWFLNKKSDTIPWRNDDEIFKQKEFVHDTLAVRSTSYNIFTFNKDTIRLNEPIRGVAYCFSPLLEDYDSEIRVFVDTENERFNSDFSNEDDIVTQVYYSLEKDTSNQKWFSDIKQSNFKYVSVFGEWFETSGPKTIRGYMEEFV